MVRFVTHKIDEKPYLNYLDNIFRQFYIHPSTKSKSFLMSLPTIFKYHSAAALVAATLLAGCGGGDGGGDAGASSTAPPPSATCDVPAQNAWLRNYMQSDYLWSGTAPNPEPAGYDTTQKYFAALLFAGNGTQPKDRWSYVTETAAYNQFFNEGKSMGYGFSVNGVERQLPLKVRYIEPKSPAITALMRGDTIVSINGIAAADLVEKQDFSILSPAKEGEKVTVVVDRNNGAGPQTITLTSATFELTPVPTNTLVTLPTGTPVGYIALKDFISQAEGPLISAITKIRAGGATDLILDMRYNGGGRIATANMLASLIAGSSNRGKVFARLNYNAQRTSSNYDFKLSGSTDTGFTRVVVLTGSRTCSASELIVNGLKPYTTVVTIGDTTCGKPFGFNPVNNCTSTYSAVNFESFNALGEGRYYTGIPATCRVADDFVGQLGSATEKLTAAALSYVQTGTCPATGDAERKQAAQVRSTAPVITVEPGERQGMWAD
jgi:carboxyl-terminal processing protease